MKKKTTYEHFEGLIPDIWLRNIETHGNGCRSSVHWLERRQRRRRFFSCWSDDCCSQNTMSKSSGTRRFIQLCLSPAWSRIAFPNPTTICSFLSCFAHRHSSDFRLWHCRQRRMSPTSVSGVCPIHEFWSLTGSNSEMQSSNGIAIESWFLVIPRSLNRPSLDSLGCRPSAAAAAYVTRVSYS